MADLETQVRQYTKSALDHVEPVRADEITTTERLPRGPRGRARLAVAVAASALFVGGGALWIVSRHGGDKVRVTSQSGASPAPTHWTQTASLDTELSNIIAVRGGIVATGYGGIWFSSDARSWKNMLTPEQPGGSAPYVSDVVATSHGLVAVGTAAEPGTSHGVAAVWTSPDGRAWTRVRDSALEPSTPPIPSNNTSPDRSSIAAIVRGGPGLVAIGEVFSGTFNGPTLVTPCCTPTVWTSRDGSTWTRIDKAGDPGGRFVDAVGRNGTVVALASMVNGTDVSKSDDGAHWQHVGIVRGSVSSVAIHGNTIVAVGSIAAANRNGRAVIWTSRTGVTWRQVYAEPSARITDNKSVVSNGHWLVVVGYRGRFEVNTRGVMAISKDAKHWAEVRRDGDVFTSDAYLNSATAFGQGFVAVGTARTGAGTPSNPVQSHTVVFSSNLKSART